MLPFCHLLLMIGIAEANVGQTAMRTIEIA